MKKLVKINGKGFTIKVREPYAKSPRKNGLKAKRFTIVKKLKK